MRTVHVAGTCRNPAALDPFIAATAPFPVARFPHVAAACARDAFITWGRRGYANAAVATVVDGYPAALLQGVSAVTALPFGRTPSVAVACTFPVASNPFMATAVPVPEAWRPDVAGAGCWHAFEARSRRGRTDDHRVVGLRYRRQRHVCGSTQGDQCGESECAFHFYDPPVRQRELNIAHVSGEIVHTIQQLTNETISGRVYL